MHLANGTLPMAHAAAYAVASGAVVALGVKQYYKNSLNNPEFKIRSGIFTAFVFMVTVLEIPMPFGSSEHPTGTPLMSIFMGPMITTFLSSVVLLLELILHEGGITTLGANVFSLGIAGGVAGWSIFYGLRKAKLGFFLCAFLAGLFGDLIVYTVTAAQLALGSTGGHSFIFYLLSFFPGQIPLAVIEGLFTGFVLSFIQKRRPEMLSDFGIL